MSPNNFMQGQLKKIEWLAADITAVGSSERAERAILGVTLAWQILANSGSIFDSGGHFMM